MRNLRFCLIKVLVLFVLINFVGCRDEKSETQIHVDLASIKETKLAEKMYDDKKAAQSVANEEKKRREAERYADEVRMKKERLAAEIQMEKERQVTIHRLEQDRREAVNRAEKEKRAARRRAFDEELRQLASTTNRFDVLVADLRARQELLQQKLDTLPDDIASVERDFYALDTILSGCMCTLVTNVREKVGIFFDSSTIPTEKVIEKRTLTPAAYVYVLKSHSKLQEILKRYDSQMIERALNMIAENTAYENDRLDRELNEVKSGRSRFSSAQQKAYSHNTTIVRELRLQLSVVEQSINEKERKLARAKVPADQNKLQAELVDLRQGKKDLETKISITIGQEKFGKASEVGVGGSFRSQEYSIKNEYEANMRESLNDARTIVLSVVESQLRELEHELESASEKYKALTVILNAHAKKALSIEQKRSLLQTDAKKRSDDVMRAASVLWNN